MRGTGVGTRAVLCFLAAVVFWPQPARAESPANASRPEGPAPVEFSPGVLPTVVAVVPGAFVHGAGHFIAGDRRTAARLLIMEGVGIGLILAGGGSLVATGAARRINQIAVPALVTGIGLFGISWAADIYGAAGGAGGLGDVAVPAWVALAARSAAPAPLELEIGHQWVSDPQFDYAHFLTASAGVRWYQWFLSGRTAIAVDANNQYARFDGGYRFLGAGGLLDRSDGTRFELSGGVSHHRYRADRFRTTTFEVEASSRVDLSMLSDSLAGAFTDVSLGYGLEVIDYQVSGAAPDVFDLLLARFAFGTYFGWPGRWNGEVSLYYDHRRDDFTAGISPSRANGSGFAGHFGAQGELWWSESFGAYFDAQIGAAGLVRTGLRWRPGGGA